MNKKKSAVAIARKMITLAWLLMTRKELYKGAEKEALERKYKHYKLEPKQWESLLSKMTCSKKAGLTEEALAA
jgi:hypothetical protein